MSTGSTGERAAFLVPRPPDPSGSHRPTTAGFDPKAGHKLDWAIVGIAILAVIFTYIRYSWNAPLGLGRISGGSGLIIVTVLYALGTVLSFIRAQQTGTAMPGKLADIPTIGN